MSALAGPAWIGAAMRAKVALVVPRKTSLPLVLSVLSSPALSARQSRWSRAQEEAAGEGTEEGFGPLAG